MYNRTDWPTVEDRGSSSLAGFDAGDLNPEHQYILPGSQVGDAISVVDTSNVEKPGMWAFKIGQDHKCEIIWHTTQKSCHTSCTRHSIML